MLATWTEPKGKGKPIPDKKDRKFQPNQEYIDNAKAEFYAKEGDLKKLCYDYLLALPMSHPTDTPNFSIGRRPVKQKGVADLIECYYGLNIAIEFKIDKNGQSDEQKQYQKDIESSGGIYLLIYQFDDLVQELAKLKKKAERIFQVLQHSGIS